MDQDQNKLDALSEIIPTIISDMRDRVELVLGEWLRLLPDPPLVGEVTETKLKELGILLVFDDREEGVWKYWLAQNGERISPELKIVLYCK